VESSRTTGVSTGPAHNAAPVEYPGWAALVYALDKKGVSPWGVS
jgi:hypothetical protein